MSSVEECEVFVTRLAAAALVIGYPVGRRLRDEQRVGGGSDRHGGQRDGTVAVEECRGETRRREGEATVWEGRAMLDRGS